MDGGLARAHGQAAVTMAGAIRLPLSGALVAPGPDQVVRLRLQKAVQRILDGPPDQLAQIGPEGFLVRCCDGSDTANLQLVLRIDNPNHTRRAVPSLLSGRYSTVKVRKLFYVTKTSY